MEKKGCTARNVPGSPLQHPNTFIKAGIPSNTANKYESGADPFSSSSTPWSCPSLCLQKLNSCSEGSRGGQEHCEVSLCQFGIRCPALAQPELAPLCFTLKMFICQPPQLCCGRRAQAVFVQPLCHLPAQTRCVWHRNSPPVLCGVEKH